MAGTDTADWQLPQEIVALETPIGFSASLNGQTTQTLIAGTEGKSIYLHEVFLDVVGSTSPYGWLGDTLSQVYLVFSGAYSHSLSFDFHGYRLAAGLGFNLTNYAQGPLEVYGSVSYSLA